MAEPVPEVENARLRQELIASHEALQELVYILTHDMSAPLRAVAQFSDIIAHKYADRLDEKGLSYFQFVQAGAEKARAMLAGLLEYARVYSAVRPFEAVSLGALLAKAMAEQQALMEVTEAEVQSGELPLLVCDPVQVQRLFAILLENSLIYRSTAAPRIEVSAAKEGAGWIVSFCDNGMGIPLDHQTDVFQVFKRLGAEEQRPGLGMGLAIAKRIMERHQGTIGVSSDGIHGSVFRLTFQENLV